MLQITEVINNNKNRHMFRCVSHESAGESFDPPEGDRVFLGYEAIAGGRQRDLVAAASYTRADKSLSQSDSQFLSSYHNVITYVFVKSRYQGKGYGRQLLAYIERDMLKHCRRTIRIQSARGAVRFFERNGYLVIGEPTDCVCGGSARFSQLYNMEKPR